MKNVKLAQLINAARHDTPPAIPADFVGDTLRLARAQAIEPRPQNVTVQSQLNSLFSPVAVACLSLIVLALVLDWSLTAAGLPQPDDTYSQTSSPTLDNADEM